MKRVEFRVPVLPDGTFKGTLVRRDDRYIGRRPRVPVDFFVADEPIGKLQAGAVWIVASGRETYDLLQGWGMNDVTRRRYCKLAKVPFKAIQELMRKRREYEASDRARDEIDNARRICSKHGYSMRKQP